MRIDRRHLLALLAAAPAAGALPAWAQWNQNDVIRPQSDPLARTAPQGTGPANPFTRLRDAPGGVSDEEEIAIGARYYAKSIMKGGGPVRDQRLQEALRSFTKQFTAVADRAHLPWEVTLLDNFGVNAWAMAGGKMAVNAGLIARCRHPGQLAAVIAHEIGHVDNQHSMRSDQLEMAAGLARHQGLNFGVPANLLEAGAAPEALADYLDLCILAYGREEEFEADEHTLIIFERLGIDPKLSVTVLELLVSLGRVNGHHQLTSLIDTHPSAAERLEVMKGKVPFARWKIRDFPYQGWDVLKAAFPSRGA